MFTTLQIAALAGAFTAAPPGGDADSHGDQGAGGPGKLVVFHQPWTKPAGAHESKVLACQAPSPLSLAAADDFAFDVNGKIGRVRWWGEILDPDQAGRPYYIAIYTDAACRPDQLVSETCVIPVIKPQGIDCLDENVFVFSAQIPPVNIMAGQRYWFQVSEIDDQSANLGQVDFRWSGHLPPRGCRAVQFDMWQNFTVIDDPCILRPSDLAFDLVLRVQ